MQELFLSYNNNNHYQTNGINVFLKNMFKITVPNFFKNLIFNGGPKINENLIDIKDICNNQRFQLYYKKSKHSYILFNLKNQENKLLSCCSYNRVKAMPTR
jgi:hypothetical protein